MKHFDVERYRVADGYTLKELLELYEAKTLQEKVSLIEELSKADAIPTKLARVILNDKFPQPRRALAKRTPSLVYEDNQGELNLAEEILKDADELVRCSMYENPTLRPSAEHFCKASHIERLAMVRNPNVDTELVSKIYDPEDKNLSLSDADRTELVRAFCTNREIVTETNKDVFDHEDFWDAAFSVMSYGDLWEKALKWLNRNNEIVRLTIRAFGTRGDKAVETYGALKDKKYVSLRRAIFENPAVQQTDSEKAFQYTELLQAGLTDEDEWIRYASIADHPSLSKEEVERILGTKNKWEFRGLVFNRHLSKESMQLVFEKLEEFDLYTTERRAFIDRYYAKQSPEDNPIEHAEDTLLDAIETKDPNGILAARVELVQKNLSAIRQDLQKMKSEMLTGSTLFWYVMGALLVFQLLKGCGS